MVLAENVAIFNWKWGQNSAPREGQKIPWGLNRLQGQKVLKTGCLLTQLIRCFH